MFSQAKRLLSITVFLCLIASAFAEESSTPFFSNKDLEKYKTEREESPKSLPPAQENKKKEAGGEQTKYEVPYKPMTSGAHRIIIPVTINNSLTVPLALDTGSTGMIISTSLAAKLGVFTKDESKLFSTVKGIGGKEIAIVTVLDTIQAGRAKDEFVPTIITATSFEEEGFEGLVGMDFMSKYTLHINTRKQVLVFEELPPTQDMPGGHDEEWWRNTFHQFASMRSEWKKLRDYLNSIIGDTVTSKESGIIYDIGALRLFSDRQYKAADKLMNKLHSYAVDNLVPMTWREY